MMAMTTSNSMSVKPCRALGGDGPVPTTRSMGDGPSPPRPIGSICDRVEYRKERATTSVDNKPQGAGLSAGLPGLRGDRYSRQFPRQWALATGARCDRSWSWRAFGRRVRMPGPWYDSGEPSRSQSPADPECSTVLSGHRDCPQRVSCHPEKTPMHKWHRYSRSKPDLPRQSESPDSKGEYSSRWHWPTSSRPMKVREHRHGLGVRAAILES
jgi:hypothetical protein